jgi:hypothetical protein
MAVFAILFVLGFTLISLNTEIYLIKNDDITHAYETLVNIASSHQDLNNQDISFQISQAGTGIASDLYLRTIRKLFSVEYAYGDGSYIEPYIVNKNKTVIEKKKIWFSYDMRRYLFNDGFLSVLAIF